MGPLSRSGRRGRGAAGRATAVRTATSRPRPRPRPPRWSPFPLLRLARLYLDRRRLRFPSLSFDPGDARSRPTSSSSSSHCAEMVIPLQSARGHCCMLHRGECAQWRAVTGGRQRGRRRLALSLNPLRLESGDGSKVQAAERRPDERRRGEGWVGCSVAEFPLRFRVAEEASKSLWPPAADATTAKK